MDPKAIRSVSRRIRKLLDHHDLLDRMGELRRHWRGPGVRPGLLEIARLAAELVPAWLESDADYFTLFLSRHSVVGFRLVSEVARLGETWWELPHTFLWERFYGSTLTDIAKRQGLDRSSLLEELGVSAIDRLGMVARTRNKPGRSRARSKDRVDDLLLQQIASDDTSKRVRG